MVNCYVSGSLVTVARRMLLPMHRRSFTATLAGTAASLLAASGAGAAPPDALDRIMASGKVQQRFGQAVAGLVLAYEQFYQTRFSDGYKAFLARENGLRFFFDTADAEKAGVSAALADMNTFFGIGNWDRNNDLLALTPSMSFYNPAFIPFAPVIGLGGDFCTFVEINGGKHAGTVMYVDGEMSGAYRHREVAGHTADELVDGFMEEGWFMLVARSFDALLADYAKMT